MESTSRHYLLLDGAQIDELMPTLYLLEPEPEFYQLYDGTRYSELAEAGPVLVATRESSALSYHFKQYWSGTAGVSLEARVPADDLIQHLRSMVHVSVSGGAVVLFRFYDPRILALWLVDMSEPRLSEVLGPVDRFHLPMKGEGYSHSGAESGNVQRYADTPWLHLSGDQLDRLNQAKRDVFEQSLLKHVDTWFPDCLASASEAERQSWARACCLRASEYGYSAATDVARWAGLVAVCGPEFPEGREHEAYRILLRQPGLQPEQKLDAIRTQIQQQLLGLNKDYAG